MIKEVIFLTDITLHTRGFRQTTNFSKVAQKGRMYSPLPKGVVAQKISVKNHSMRFSFDLPQDLKDKLDRGEIELMMPTDGLNIYLGEDALELIRKKNEQKRKQVIHRNRNNTWRAEDTGVK